MSSDTNRKFEDLRNLIPGNQVVAIVGSAEASATAPRRKAAPAAKTPLLGRSRRRLRVTSRSNSERSANRRHLLWTDAPDKPSQSGFLDCLYVVEIDCRIVLESFVNSDNHLARRAANRRRDWGNHYGVKQPNDLGPR